MRTIREILRLHFEHDLSQTGHCQSLCGLPHDRWRLPGTHQAIRLDWPAISALDDSSLKTLLYP